MSYWKDTKVVWSALLWVLYAALLFSRMKFNVAGRRFAVGTISVFLFVLMTFWGTNLLSPLHHP
jgi:ABC-type transport system involved in cytochrome c biogenesis permease subunit